MTQSERHFWTKYLSNFPNLHIDRSNPIHISSALKDAHALKSRSVLLLWESLRLPYVCHALNRISGGLKGNQNIERPDSLLSSRGRDFYAGLDRADPVDRLYDMIWYMVWFGIWYSVVCGMVVCC